MHPEEDHAKVKECSKRHTHPSDDSCTVTKTDSPKSPHIERNGSSEQYSVPPDDSSSASQKCDSRSTELPKEHTVTMVTSKPSNGTFKAQTMNHDKQHTAHSSETTKAYSSVDGLRLRTHLLEMVEELKLRRLSDKEYEERFHQLIESKHELTLKCEEAEARTSALSEAHEKKLADIRRHNLDKNKDLEEAKKKLEIVVSRHEQEAKLLKDDIKCLQMTKYNFEKQLKERDQRLHLRDSVREKSLTQLSTLETSCRDMVQRMEQLSAAENRLEKNVLEAQKINQQLMHQAEHHECEVSGYKVKVTELQRSLSQARVELDVQPKQLTDDIKQRETEILALKNTVKTMECEISLLQSELQQAKTDQEKIENQLHESNALISRHVLSLDRKTQECRDQDMRLQKLSETNTELQTKCERVENELTEQRQAMDTAQKVWTEKESSLSSRLRTLQEDHEALSRAHTSLEELNSKWSSKNAALTQEVESLKAQLMKPKADAQQQTVPDVCVAWVQTEVNVSSVCCQSEPSAFARHCQTQTEINQASSLSQTDVLDKCDVQVQTDETLTQLCPPTNFAPLPENVDIIVEEKDKLSETTASCAVVKPMMQEMKTSITTSHQEPAKPVLTVPCLTPQPSASKTPSLTSIRTISETFLSPPNRPEKSASDSSLASVKRSPVKINHIQHQPFISPAPSASSQSTGGGAKRRILSRKPLVVNQEKAAGLLQSNQDVITISEDDRMPSSQPSLTPVMQCKPLMDQESNSEPLPGDVAPNFTPKDPSGDLASDELSPYSRFTATLKSIASIFKPHGQKPELTSGTYEPLFKRRRTCPGPDGDAGSAVDQAIEEPDSSTDPSYVTRPENRLHINKLSPQHSKLSRSHTSGDKVVEKPTGILQESPRIRTRGPRRVTFAKKLEHHNDSPSSSLSGEVGSPGGSTVSVREQQRNDPRNMGRKIPDDVYLFSEDEEDRFDLGDQLDRVNTILSQDRKMTTKPRQ